MINGLKDLRYLDDRPVKQLDRLAAEAYMKGGREAENKVRKEYLQAEREKLRDNVRRTREFEEQAKRQRQRQIESIKKDVQDKKQKLLDKRSNLREMIRNARLTQEEKQKTEWAIESVDQELNSDMFHIINDSDIVVPPLRRVADQANQPQERERREKQRREEREREAREREIKEYEERERVNLPKAQGIIPVPVKDTSKVKTRAERMRDEGVVMSTDSESENDPTLFAKRAGYKKVIFKWTKFYEDKLEELLIKHMFDFITVAQEFSALVNNFDNEEMQEKFYYEITPKILQMKWTDIEIKEHRMAEFIKDEEEDEEYINFEQDRTDGNASGVQEFGTDEPVRTYGQTSSVSALVKDDSSSKKSQSTTPSVNRFHDFGSSSEEEDNSGSYGYTNLEELD